MNQKVAGKAAPVKLDGDFVPNAIGFIGESELFDISICDYPAIRQGTALARTKFGDRCPQARQSEPRRLNPCITACEILCLLEPVVSHGRAKSPL